jgi:DNA-binding CsgD family transcriptional regulator
VPDFRPKEKILIVVFACFVIISGLDIAMDFSEGADFAHVAQEATILTLSLLALAWLLFDLRRQANEISKLRSELAEINTAAPMPGKYVLEAKLNLSQVISHQFNDWQLTDSEKDVGWLLLKGLSLKEIAAIRNTLEKTVRQQASAIYKKAGLSGRHAFSAWFIEDVL